MSASVPLAFNIVGNISQLKAALDQSQAAIATTTSAMSRMANALDGSKLIADANAMVVAVNKLGGASTLTESEQARVNTTVQTAIEKYAALGQQAPAALVALGNATSQNGSILANLGPQLEELFTHPIEGAQSLVALVGTELTSALTGLGPAGIVAAAGLVVAVGATVGLATGILALTDHAADSGEQVLAFSQKTGIAVQNVGQLQFAVTAASGSLDDLSNLLQKLTLKEASDTSGKFAAALKDIGINADAFNKMDNESKILALAQGFQKGAASGDLMKDAIALMGRSGAENIPILLKLNNQLLAAGAQLGVQWSQDDVKAAEQFRLGINTVEAALGSVAAKVGVALLPAMSSMITSFATSTQFINVVSTAALELTHGLGYVVIAVGEMTGGFLGFIAFLATVDQKIDNFSAAFLQAVIDVLGGLSKLPGASNQFAGAIAVLTANMDQNKAESQGLASEHDKLAVAADQVRSVSERLGGSLAKVTGKTADETQANLSLNQSHQAVSASTAAHQKAVQALLDTLTTGGKQLSVTVDAFKQLSDSQKSDADVAAALIPVVDKLVASHRQVPPALMDWYTHAIQTRDALVQQQAAILATMPGIEAHVASMKAAGDSEQEMATQLGVTVAALKLYETQQTAIIDVDKKVKLGIDDILTSLAKMGDQPTKMFTQITEGYKQVDAAQASLNDLILQDTDTTTEYQIQKVNDWARQQLAAYKGDGENYAAYAATIRAEAAQKTNDLIVDAQKLRTQSLAALQETADREWNTYFAMRAAPDQYSQAAINAQERIAQAADRVTEQVSMDWGTAFSGIAIAALKAFASGGSASQAIAGGLSGLGAQWSDQLLGWNGLAGNLYASAPKVASALGDLAGPLGGAAVTLGLDLGKKLWDALFGDAGRQAVEQFAATFQGNFAGLHDQLSLLGAQGEQLWVQLTQGTGNNNAAQAAANIKAVQDALAAYYQTQNTSIASLVSQIQGFGGSIDPSLDAYIQRLRQANILTSANVTALQALEGTGKPTLQDLTTLQQKYNLTAAQMGPSFQTEQIDANFQTIIDDLDTLTRGGADVVAAMFTVGADGAKSLSGLGTAVRDDIQAAIDAGVAIPANLKGAAQALIANNDLLSATGQTITDVNSLTFGDTMQTDLEKLTATLQQLIDTLNKGLPAAVNTAAGSWNAAVGSMRGLPGGDLSGTSFTATPAATGGIVTRGKVIPFPMRYYDVGGFVPRGTDTVPAMLTPGEVVLNAAQQRQLGAGGSIVVEVTLTNQTMLDGNIIDSRMRKLAATGRMRTRTQPGRSY